MDFILGFRITLIGVGMWKRCGDRIPREGCPCVHDWPWFGLRFIYWSSSRGCCPTAPPTPATRCTPIPCPHLTTPCGRHIPTRNNSIANAKDCFRCWVFGLKQNHGQWTLCFLLPNIKHRMPNTVLFLVGPSPIPKQQFLVFLRLKTRQLKHSPNRTSNKTRYM